jgi:hypothetical protein
MSARTPQFDPEHRRSAQQGDRITHRPRTLRALLDVFAFLVRPFVSERAWPWVGYGAITGEKCTYAEDHGILDDPCNTGTNPWDEDRRAWKGHGAMHGGNGWQTW